jgi:hypothetical protein
MTDDPTSPLPGDVEAGIAITTAAATAVSSMFDTVFATLTTDLQQLLQTNGTPNPLALPLHALTTEMIKVLGDRVKETLDSARK